MACWLVNLGLVAITTVVACCTLFASAADIDTIDITVLLHAGSSPADASISQQPTTLLSAIHSTDRPLGSDASEAALLFGSLPKAFSADACSRWQGSEQLFDVSLTQAARPGRQQSWPKGLMVRTSLASCPPPVCLLALRNWQHSVNHPLIVAGHY